MEASQDTDWEYFLENIKPRLAEEPLASGEQILDILECLQTLELQTIRANERVIQNYAQRVLAVMIYIEQVRAVFLRSASLAKAAKRMQLEEKSVVKWIEWMGLTPDDFLMPDQTLADLVLKSRAGWHVKVIQQTRGSMRELLRQYDPRDSE